MSVADIAYVVFNHVDLLEAERFYTDFGLTVAYRNEFEVAFRPAMERSYCYVARKADKPGLVSIGLSAASQEDLVVAAQFPEASPIQAIERPGGGQVVRLTSPDGVNFELVHGIDVYPARPVRDALSINTGIVKTRHGQWQRPELEPASILRLGHVALLTGDFKTNAQWLRSRFGFMPSDVLFADAPENQVGAFFHCTGGNPWTDHHTLALFPSDGSRMHHCSFEIQDLDAQFLGNKWLASRGWKPGWGVGRHILGSQIFDYWFDPAGNLVEHFTDGDLIQAGAAPGMHPLDDDALAMWGPPLTASKFVAMAARHN
uniref:Trihydroxytoluene oxygenase n=1 Tax=Burkholderia cepacia TaxID=292 RepID=O87474_BURCE|nr:trihydroxytoluene oxygenase [Burkholderia cepacia]